MVKIKTWELLFKVSSFNSSFFFQFFFSILTLFFAQFMLVYVCLGQSYSPFHVLYMLGCLIFVLKFYSIYVFLGFLGKRLRTHNLACARRLVLACVSRYPETLIYICLFCFCLHMFVLFGFVSYVLGSISFCLPCSHALFAITCLDQGFLVLMQCHSFTCPCINAIGVELLQGK